MPAKRITNSKKNEPLNLDRGTFGGTEACRFLVDMLNERNDHALAHAVISQMTAYNMGLSELLKTSGGTRETLMNTWLEMAMAKASKLWINYGIDPTVYTGAGKKHATVVSLYDNILKYRWRQSINHGQLLEKFREKDMEHVEILQALKNLAKYEKLRE